jgi:urease accessory protein
VTDVSACPPQLDLRFAYRAGRTYLERRLFSWPFALTRTFHLDAKPAHMLSAILQTSSGAVHGDDRLVQRIHVGLGAAAHVTTQGATAVHRAHEGAEASERVSLVVEAGGCLEYLPEPKIFFPGAALSQSVELTCDPGGCAVLSDAFLAHDPDGRGRGFRHFAAETIIRRPPARRVPEVDQTPVIPACAGIATANSIGAQRTLAEPLLVDRFDIDGLPPRRQARAAFAAFGTLYAVLPRDGAALERLSAEMTEAMAKIPGLYAAASLLPSNIGVSLRLAADGGTNLRKGLEAGWRAARRAMTGDYPAARRK